MRSSFKGRYVTHSKTGLTAPEQQRVGKGEVELERGCRLANDMVSQSSVSEAA